MALKTWTKTSCVRSSASARLPSMRKTSAEHAPLVRLHELVERTFVARDQALDQLRFELVGQRHVGPWCNTLERRVQSPKTSAPRRSRAARSVPFA